MTTETVLSVVTLVLQDWLGCTSLVSAKHLVVNMCIALSSSVSGSDIVGKKNDDWRLSFEAMGGDVIARKSFNRSTSGHDLYMFIHQLQREQQKTGERYRLFSLCSLLPVNTSYNYIELSTEPKSLINLPKITVTLQLSMLQCLSTRKSQRLRHFWQHTMTHSFTTDAMMPHGAVDV